MNAREAFQAAQLQQAISLGIEAVRANPADRGKRTFLFELLVFAGELDRASRQLEAIAPSDPDEAIAIEVYRSCLAAERARREVFTGGGLPEFRVDPPEYAGFHIQCLERLRRGDASGASAALAEARSRWGELAGSRGDAPFAGFRDLDDLTAPFLEVFDRGSYVWVPMERLRSVSVRAPKFPRDLIWAPTEITLHNGQVGQVFVPVLYPMTTTSSASTDAHRLGRTTDWIEPAPGLMAGIGHRMFLVGDQDVSVLELGTVLLSEPQAG